MRIVLMNGGLGNQLFQYFFIRFAERTCPEETWYIDDSAFFVSHEHNGYELEKIWGIKANLLSEYFDQDVWREIIQLRKAGMSFPQIYSGVCGEGALVFVAETSDFSFQGEVVLTPANEFHPDIISLPYPNVYYHGYWISKHWFDHYRAENLAELSFPALADERNIKYAEMVNSSLSVGVHIRRGDFLKWNLALPPEYYQTSCRNVLASYPDARFFVFTDDVDWCRANEEALGLNLAPHTVYVSGNRGEKSYIDAQLLSMCQGIIMSNSSFCYFAALMDKNLKFWVNPTQREV